MPAAPPRGAQTKPDEGKPSAAFEGDVRRGGWILVLVGVVLVLVAVVLLILF